MSLTKASLLLLQRGQWSMSPFLRMKCWIDPHSSRAKPSWGIQSSGRDDMNVTGGVCVFRGGSKQWTRSPVQLLSIALAGSACCVCPFSFPLLIVSGLHWHITVSENSQRQVGKLFFLFFFLPVCDVCGLGQHRWERFHTVLQVNHLTFDLVHDYTSHVLLTYIYAYLSLQKQTNSKVHY